MIEGTIESIAFGGSGVLRDNGLVIFVPFTAPGDKLSVQIVDKRKRFAIGNINTVFSPSSERTTPKCPHFSQCGGCQLQHLNYSTQLAAKKRFVEETFQRIGGLIVPDFDIQGTEDIYGYRRHIRCNFQKTENGFFLGFYATDNKTLINVQECPIFFDGEKWVFNVLRDIFISLSQQDKPNGQVRIFKLNDKTVQFAFTFPSRPSNEFIKILKDTLAKDSRLVAATVVAPGFSLEIGNNTDVIDVHNLRIEYSPSCFIQNHPTQSLAVYAEIARISASLAKSTILDLFCGIGITSLLCARQGHQVVGVEWNRTAIEYARKNSLKNKVPNVRFEASSCEDFLKKNQSKFDLVLLNPPRTGISEGVFDSLKKTAPKAILYISCMPSTLARDAKELVKEGYEISYIKVFDMFPQTTHVETLVLLYRT